VQYFCDTEYLFMVGPEAFYPPPKVDSAVVRLTPHQQRLEVKDLDTFTQVVKLAFGQRRKTLRNALKEIATAEQLSTAGVEPIRRAEQLTVAEFANISNVVTAK